MSKVTALRVEKTRITHYNRPNVLTAKLQLTYLSGNTHSHFSVTGEVASIYRPQYPQTSGSIHTEIKDAFPHLEKYLKWHLTNSTGIPMHYRLNSLYWHEKQNFSSFKQSCIFGAVESDKNFTVSDFMRMDGNAIDQWLTNRLDAVRQAFITDMLELFPHLTVTDFD